MQHEQSSTKIFFTKEYGRLRIISGNRPLNESKINRIKSDIDDGIDVLRYCPLMVCERDGRLDIIDGQHRFFVAKEMGSHVWYVLVENISLREIAKINSNTERWKDKDFINCYAINGNENYRILEDFLTKYRFPISAALKLLNVKTDSLAYGGYSAKKSFNDGQFQVTSLEYATKIAENVMLFSDFPKHNSGPFIFAIIKLMESDKIKISDLVERFKKYPDELTAQPNVKAYLFNMESLYNKGKHTREVIY